MPEIIAVLIPIVAIVMVFGWLIASSYFESRAKEAYMKERLAAIEKGMTPPPPPPGLFDEDDAAEKIAALGGKDTNTPTSRYLMRGLMWSFIGLGIGGAFWGMGKEGTAFLGLIPLAVGLAYLVFCALQGRKDDADEKR